MLDYHFDLWAFVFSDFLSLFSSSWFLSPLNQFRVKHFQGRHSKLDSPLGPYSWIPRILSIFDKMREHQPFKAPAKNYENRAWVCMDFKNYLAWLTGIKKLIFHSNNFFGSGHFLIIFSELMDWKMAGAKKVVRMKNQFFMPVNHVR